jgi:hypothetical protein
MVLSLFESGSLAEAAGGFFKPDAGHMSRDPARMGIRLADALARGKSVEQHLASVGVSSILTCSPSTGSRGLITLSTRCAHTSGFLRNQPELGMLVPSARGSGAACLATSSISARNGPES